MTTQANLEPGSAEPDRPTPVVRRGFTGAAVVLAGVVSLALWARPPGEYVAAQWLFSYADGLVRRSLVGSLFQAAGGQLGQDLEVGAVGVYLAIVLAMAWHVSRHMWDRAGRAHVATPLIAALVLAPSGLPALAAGLGQLDAIVVLVVAVLLLVVRPGSAAGHVAAAGLLVLAVLVHEAALVLVVPWVCAYLALHLRRERPASARWTVAALVGLPAVLVLVALLLHTPATTRDALASTLGVGRVPEPQRLLAAGVHFRGLVENVQLTWLFMRTGGPLALVTNVLAILPVTLLAAVTVRRAGVGWGDLRRDHRVLLLASLLPLTLCAVAMDWGRWFSVTASLLGISSVIIVRDVRGLTGRPATFLWVGAAVAVGLTLVVGGTAEHAFHLTYRD